MQNEAQNEAVFALLNPQGSSSVVLTCEHASYIVPPEYRDLGISSEELSRHIGWDIGARWVVETLSQVLDAPAICSGYSRLLIDCNRDVTDHDLIVAESDGTKIQGNVGVTEAERERRITQFYQPYHDAIDRLLEERTGKETILLSIHSFTPVLGTKQRPFELGVLFDRHEDLALEVGQRLHQQEYRIRYNEPYSGLDGLIFSARSHGERHGLLYLELEINNGIIAQPNRAQHVGRMLGEVLKPLFSTAKKEES